MKKKILVTGIGGDIGQSIIKCLNDVGYFKQLIGCDVDRYAAGKKDVAAFYQITWVKDSQNYLKKLDTIIKNERIDYIFPTTEPEIEFFHKNRDYFSSRNIKLFINDPFIINTFFDKYETVTFLKNNNLPYPVTYKLEDYNGELSYPFILKQRRTWGGKGLEIIQDNEELNYFKKKRKQAIIQEMIGTSDEEYTVGVFSNGEDVYTISFKRRLGYDNLSKVAELVYDKRLSELSKKIAREIKLKGVLNIQFRKRDNEYMPFEINPRLSSTVFIRHCLGFQDIRWWINLMEGKEIHYERRYRKAVAVRKITEVFFDKDKII